MARKLLIILFYPVFFLLSTLANHAYAYIDPGSGSYLFQIMLASLVGAAFAVKAYWIKIKEFLKKLFSHKDLS